MFVSLFIYFIHYLVKFVYSSVPESSKKVTDTEILHKNTKVTQYLWKLWKLLSHWCCGFARDYTIKHLVYFVPLTSLL